MSVVFSKKHFPMIMFPWDLIGDPGGAPWTDGVVYGGVGAFGGGEVDFLTISDTNWWTEPQVAMRMYTRVKRWTLQGNLVFAPDNIRIEGSCSVDCDAVDYITGSPLVDERNILRHGGWHGINNSISGWTITTTEEDGSSSTEGFDPGPMELRLWPHVGFPLVVTGAADAAAVFFQPELSFLADRLTDYPGSMHFGRGIAEDNCQCTTTFPATHGGSFDGTDFHGFTLQMGAPTIGTGTEGIVQKPITGVFTLQPSAWWPYDPGDIDPTDTLGPYYDLLSGAWLRTPPGY